MFALPAWMNCIAPEYLDHLFNLTLLEVLLGAHPPEGTVDHERLSVWLAERIGGDGEER